MFKKTLIALAMTGAAFGATAATTMATDTDATTNAPGAAAAGAGKAFMISAEGAVGAGSVVFGSHGLNIEIDDSGTSAKGFTTLEYITVKLSGATLHPNSAPAVKIFAADGTTAITVTGAVVDYVAGVSDTYRIKLAAATRTALIAAASGGKTDNFKVLLSGAAIANNLASGAKISATVSFISTVGSSVIDSVSGDFAQVIPQLSTKITSTGLKQSVSVGGARKVFVGGGANHDTASVDVVTTAKAVDLLSVTTAGATQKLSTSILGDFTFLDADKDGKVDTGTSATGYVKGGQSLLGVVATPAIVAGGKVNTQSFSIKTDKKRVIPTQNFTYKTSMLYKNAGISAATYTATGSAGTWSLDGSTDTLAFMPFGPAYAQSITVTNSGTVEGNITVEFQFEGKKTTADLKMVAAKNAVTNISAKVAEAAKAAGIVGNARIRVIIDSPESQIVTTGLYYSKADADRVLVPTS